MMVFLLCLICQKRTNEVYILNSISKFSHPLSVSQNFPTSRSTINRLLRLTNIISADIVLEIGAGRGHITRALLDCGCRSQAIELERALYDRLTILFNGQPNLRLTYGNFFRLPLPTGAYKYSPIFPFPVRRISFAG